ncbi:Microtubule-associated TORTIFOLIA1-like protein [Gossypium australe]|uniref:Microtubule-associated TORTIFOLIA1-like protein n=1 Tax=Gossypium australe TaxID=47621 RepID=A0A5B6U6R7_9ROSI|nr:Microtubule-associated TORTIFOLIA1-like protein [Gossypium australe]
MYLISKNPSFIFREIHTFPLTELQKFAVFPLSTKLSHFLNIPSFSPCLICENPIVLPLHSNL